MLFVHVKHNKHLFRHWNSFLSEYNFVLCTIQFAYADLLFFSVNAYITSLVMDNVYFDPTRTDIAHSYEYMECSFQWVFFISLSGFLQTYNIGNNTNIGIGGFTTWKQ